MRKTMAGIYLWMGAYDYSAVNLISAPFRSGELNETLISPASPVVLSVVTCCKRIIVKLAATLTIMSMSVSCSKENSAGFIWLLSESGTVDYSAQNVQLGYKVIMDNGSSV